MTTAPLCIMLIDDDRNDNFFHEREIKKNYPEAIVIVMERGLDALGYLKSMIKKKDVKPVIIFLDINMPGMNGWEFLDQYGLLDKETQSNVLIIMLTTSDNPESKERAMGLDFVSDYITKPLTKEKFQDPQKQIYSVITGIPAIDEPDEKILYFFA